MTTLFDGFYQMGFVARDLDRATKALAESHGITRFRRKRASGRRGPGVLDRLTRPPAAAMIAA